MERLDQVQFPSPDPDDSQMPVGCRGLPWEGGEEEEDWGFELIDAYASSWLTEPGQFWAMLYVPSIPVVR